MFADYRVCLFSVVSVHLSTRANLSGSVALLYVVLQVPDILHQMGAISYSKGLEVKLTSRKLLEPGSDFEISIRAASILAVERIKTVLLRLQTEIHVNSVLIDFFLWDFAKQLGCSSDNLAVTPLPHHRTRSTWY